MKLARRPRPAERITSRYLVYILLLITLEVLITWTASGADPPPGYDRNAFALAENHQVLAMARPGESTSGVLGPTAWSVPASVFYNIYGVSLASSRAVAALGALVALLLLVEGLRRRLGTGPALLAGLLLAAHPAWHAVVRTPSPYPWVAAWMLFFVSLAGQRKVPWWCVGATGVGAGLVLHPLLWIVVPALVSVWIERELRKADRGPQRSDMRLWGMLTVVATALPTAGAIVLATGADLSMSSWLYAEELTGVFSAFPFLIAMAWLGVCLELARPQASLPTGLSLARRVVGVGLPTCLVLGETSLAVFSAFVPLLVVLACSTLVRIWQLTAEAQPVTGASNASQLRPASVIASAVSRGLFGLLGSGYILSQLRIASEGTLPQTSLIVLTTGCLIILSFSLGNRRGTQSRRGWSSRARQRCQWAAALGAVLVVCVPRGIGLMSDTDRTLQRANRQLQSLVLPTARIAGRAAHALSVENDLRTFAWPRDEDSVPEYLEENKITHVLLDHARWDESEVRRLTEGGVPVERVETLVVCGSPLHLYRVNPRAPRSAFETALVAERRGRSIVAESWFLHLATVHPQSALSWARMGRAILRRSDLRQSNGALVHAIHPSPLRIMTQLALAGIYRERHRFYHDFARDCFHAALQVDPKCVDARVGLFHLYDRQGFRREARHHLSAASEAEPGNRLLRELLAQYEVPRPD